MRELEILLLFLISTNLFSGCSGRAQAEIAADKIRQICVGQKKYFEEYKKYGTLEELSKTGFVLGDRLNWDDLSDGKFYGYNYTIEFTSGGYIARASPDGFGSPEAIARIAFYVDEKNKITARFRNQGGEAGPNDEEFLEEGREPIISEE